MSNHLAAQGTLKHTATQAIKAIHRFTFNPSPAPVHRTHEGDSVHEGSSWQGEARWATLAMREYTRALCHADVSPEQRALLERRFGQN